MLPEFLRRLLRKRESAKVQDEPAQPGGETSFFVRELAAGNTEALGELVIRFDKVMIATARQLTKRYHVRGVAVEAEDVLSQTLLRLLAEASEGRLSSIKNTADFWWRFYNLLRMELSALKQETRALKRGGQGRSPAPTAGSPAALGQLRRHESEALDELIDPTPGPDDLALAALQVEVMLKPLESPSLRRIARMRQEDYTAQEIADQIGAGVRTVERCLSEIRGVYTQRGWDNDAIRRVLARAAE